MIADHPDETIANLVKSGQLAGRPSDVAICVKRLSEGRFDRSGLGLVDKTWDKGDRRCCRLSLSDKGQHWVREVLEQSGLTLEHLIRLTGLLQKYRLNPRQWHVLCQVANNPGTTTTRLVNSGKLTGRPGALAIIVRRLAEGLHGRGTPWPT